MYGKSFPGKITGVLAGLLVLFLAIGFAEAGKTDAGVLWKFLLEKSEVSDLAVDDVFEHIDGRTFSFLSGAGGWSTEVVISGDGSFTGYFHDTDMGDDGDGYPDGTRYECFFAGAFVVDGKIDPFTYALRLTALDDWEEEGVERIEDGVRVISAGPYGMEEGDVFMLYFPGRETADLPEAFLEWIRMPNAWEEVPGILPFYGLYNVMEEFGFFS